MMVQPFWITQHSPPEAFPDAKFALDEPNGLLAAGGDLSPERLLCAYRKGIFPWFSDGQPILWWSPDPRAVLYPRDFHMSRSLKKVLRSQQFQVTQNQAFSQIIRLCGGPRATQDGTWITEEMIAAYTALHQLGHAHSYECWHEGRLVGGLYGVALGSVFFGESMFSARADASKVALAALCDQPYTLIDCQLPSDHLMSLGAVATSRKAFLALLERWCAIPLEIPRDQTNRLQNLA